MKKLGFFLLLQCIAVIGFGQARGNANQQNRAYQKDKYNSSYNNKSRPVVALAGSAIRNDVTFDIKILMNVKADSYLAIFHLSQVGRRTGEIDTLMNKRINGFKRALTRVNIPEKDVFIDMLTFVPVYEYVVERKLFSKTYNEVPKGFEMKKNIHVRFKDERVLDKIVTAAAQNEIYDLVRVDYFVDDMEGVYDTMREKAVTIAAKKEKLHQDLGVDLSSRYRYVNDKSAVSMPYDNYFQYQAYTNNNLFSNSLIAKKGKVQLAEKAWTLYYQPIAYKDFDAVITPSVLEPVVQFTYNLKITYLRNKENKEETPKVPEKTVIKKQYYVLKPDGSLQFLDIK
mgnify:CR=1 FL=1